MQETTDILLVEDNAGDIRIIKETIGESHVAINLHIAKDGLQALDFLHRRGPYVEAPRPRLVLLDLNLPNKNGYDVLREMKADHELKHIPVIILSSSRSDQDVRRAYDLHANSYIPKPTSFEAYLTTFQNLEAFWLSTALIPNDSHIP
ncbi:MAG: response regulator [Nitrospira sp.]|nr:response regulator [Nitrospira sp.]